MATGEPPRSSHGPSFGQGFGNVSTTWNGGIWGTSAIGSGLRNTTNENARIQGMTPKASHIDWVRLVALDIRIRWLEWKAEDTVALNGQYLVGRVDNQHETKRYFPQATSKQQPTALSSTSGLIFEQTPLFLNHSSLNPSINAEGDTTATPRLE
ncbi:MAG: hypothetical protein Q9210_005114 [Variospora velana]